MLAWVVVQRLLRPAVMPAIGLPVAHQPLAPDAPGRQRRFFQDRAAAAGGDFARPAGIKSESMENSVMVEPMWTAFRETANHETEGARRTCPALPAAPAAAFEFRPADVPARAHDEPVELHGAQQSQHPVPAQFVASVSFYRLSAKAPQQTTFVFLNEAHFLRCRDRIADMDPQPFCSIFDTAASRETLEEKYKAKFLAFTFAMRQTHRHIAVCTETLTRPQIMKIMMGIWKAGRNCFWMTSSRARAAPHILDENIDKIIEIVNHLF